MTQPAEPVRFAETRAGVYLLLTALWALCSMLIWLPLGGNLRILARLRAHGVAVDARIVELPPAGGAMVAFEVEGMRRTARSAYVGPPNPRQRELQVGEPVRVWYLPEDPQQVAAGNPQQLMRRDVSVSLSMLFGMLVSFPLYGLALRLGRRNRPGG